MKVRYDLSRTVNLGNYESAKIGIGIETDVPDGSTLDETFAWIRAWVNDKVAEEEDLWTGEGSEK